MTAMTLLIVALVAFVGSHLALSHPLRAPLVARIGEGGFAGVYSLVAAATLFWTVAQWRATPAHLLWTAPGWAYPLAAVVMLFASVLFVGSVTAPNPSLMGSARVVGASGPRGVQRITRHPMMWSFALWAAVHAALSGDARTVVLCAGIGFLALVGARNQDGKKRTQLGPAWDAHERATSFVPFGGQFGGRRRWATANPGAVALIGGAVLLAVATALHPYAGGPELWGLIV